MHWPLKWQSIRSRSYAHGALNALKCRFFYVNLLKDHQKNEQDPSRHLQCSSSFPSFKSSRTTSFRMSLTLREKLFARQTVLLLGRWQRGLLHLHELESEYTNHFNLHPLLCLTTAEYPSVVRLVSLHVFGIIWISLPPPCALCLCRYPVLGADSTTVNTFITPLNPTLSLLISPFTAWHLCFVFISSEQAIKP